MAMASARRPRQRAMFFCGPWRATPWCSDINPAICRSALMLVAGGCSACCLLYRLIQTRCCRRWLVLTTASLRRQILSQPCNAAHDAGWQEVHQQQKQHAVYGPCRNVVAKRKGRLHPVGNRLCRVLHKDNEYAADQATRQ